MRALVPEPGLSLCAAPHLNTGSGALSRVVDGAMGGIEDGRGKT